MKKRLLLADDSITIQKVIQITFSHDDYVMTVVDNGDAALEKARAERPSLILADVFMPGKNGYELCAAVKQDPALAGVPVLLLTGTFEPFDEGKAKAAGADKWIAKPFESQTLINCVEELLSKATAAPQSSLSMPTPSPATATPSQRSAVPVFAAPTPSAQPGTLPSSVATSAPSGSLAPPETELDIWGEDYTTEPLATDSIPLADAAPVEMAEMSDLWDMTGQEAITSPVEAATSATDLWSAFEDETPALLPKPCSGGDESVTAKTDLWAEGDLMSSFDTKESNDSAIFDATLLSNDLLPLGDVEVLEEIDLVESPVANNSIDATQLQSAVFQNMPSPEMNEPSFAETVSWETDSTFSLNTNEYETMQPPAVPAETSNTTTHLSIQPSAVSTQIQSLSEADLEKIVERVAGTVIERLAGAVLEKIAWEVVPDLAESMIKEEIFKIKEEAKA